MKEIFRLDMLVQDDDFDRVSGLLALEVPFGWEEQSLPTGETTFRVHCEHKDFLENLQDSVRAVAMQTLCRLESMEEQDWLATWKQFFTPVCCGKNFVVLPPWLAADSAFAGRTKIVIEPKSAFGTGHHATTALCLTVVSDLLDAGRLKSGQVFLDLGTGSGVLGIGCCKHGLHGVGLDIDVLAVDNARENCALNAVGTAFNVRQGSIEGVAGQQFDVVLANILARPLTEMAPAITAVRKNDGVLVLSGLLTIQADGVEAAYRAQGLPAARRIVQDEWYALVWD